MTLIVVTLGMGLFAKRGFFDLRRLQRQTEELETKIEGAKRSRDELEASIERLRVSTAEQERVVRTRLGYVRPNETVVEFE